MKKRSIKIILLLILGIIVGLINLFIGLADVRNFVFTIIGFISLFLTLGIFMLWNWARVIAIIFSCLFIGLYILIFIITIKGGFYGWGGIGLIANLPTLLLSLLFLDISQKDWEQNRQNRTK